MSFYPRSITLNASDNAQSCFERAGSFADKVGIMARMEQIAVTLKMVRLASAKIYRKTASNILLPISFYTETLDLLACPMNISVYSRKAENDEP